MNWGSDIVRSGIIVRGGWYVPAPPGPGSSSRLRTTRCATAAEAAVRGYVVSIRCLDAAAGVEMDDVPAFHGVRSGLRPRRSARPRKLATTLSLVARAAASLPYHRRAAARPAGGGSGRGPHPIPPPARSRSSCSSTPLVAASAVKEVAVLVASEAANEA